MGRKKTTDAPAKDSPAHGPSALITRLLQTVTVSARAIRSKVSQPRPLPPPGKRSGRGSESIEPYLSQGRSTRPGSLE